MRRFHLPIASLLSRGFLTGMLLLLPLPLCAQTEQKPLRVAIVGLVHGHVAGFLAQLPQHADVELVGIAEPDPELHGEVREEVFVSPRRSFFKSPAKMIEARQPQAVLVYTTIAEHRHAIEIAAHYGVSVMVEKPLTISLDDALAIRKIAREHHIHVLVNYETTWYASNKAAYDEVKKGAIWRRAQGGGARRPPRAKEIGVSPEFLKWLTDPAQNGAGSLYDFGCYGVDLMTWLMHGETPQTVTAVVNHDKPEIYPKVDDDSTIVSDSIRTRRR